LFCPSCKREYDDRRQICPADGTALVPQRPDPLPADPTTAAPGSVPRAGTAVRVGSGGDPAQGGGPQDSDPRLAPGQMVDEYKITGKLGEGGMGTVYAGVQPVIGKRVAIKVLLHEFSTNLKVVGRFVQEARAVNQIHSRYIVDIFSFGELEDRRPYFVMEFLQGVPLRDHIRSRGRLGFDEAHGLLQCVLRGLAAAHAEKIVHRDLKPENIMVVAEEGEISAKILDFGIAKLQAGPGGGVPGVATQTGVAMGTPYYMSPEQVRGIGVDHRSDIYALGVIMFEMFTGALPFVANSYIELVNKHLYADPPDPVRINRELPEELGQLILRCIAKDAEVRPQSANELLDALAELRPRMTGVTLPSLGALPETVSEVQTSAAPASPGVPAAAPGQRWGLWIGLMALVVALAAGAALALYLLRDRGGPDAGTAAAGGQGDDPAQARPAPAARAQLQISSRPAGAVVQVDGEPRGKTPLMVRIVPGPHQVLVALAGHVTVSEKLTLTAGGQRDLSYDLAAAPAAPAPDSGPPPDAAAAPDQRPAAREPVRTTGGRKARDRKAATKKRTSKGNQLHDKDDTLNPFARPGH
jgi:serine/threonine-protein kinase